MKSVFILIFAILSCFVPTRPIANGWLPRDDRSDLALRAREFSLFKKKFTLTLRKPEHKSIAKYFDSGCVIEHRIRVDGIHALPTTNTALQILNRSNLPFQSTRSTWLCGTSLAFDKGGKPSADLIKVLKLVKDSSFENSTLTQVSPLEESSSFVAVSGKYASGTYWEIRCAYSNEGWKIFAICVETN